MLRVAEADEARMERVMMENRNLRHSLKETRIAVRKLEQACIPISHEVFRLA